MAALVFCAKITVYKLHTDSLICYYLCFIEGFFLFSCHRWANLYTETRFAAPKQPDGLKELVQKVTMYL